MANRVGRPLLYDSPEKLQKDIDAYFENTPKIEWTITGLALALNTSRETLQNYKDRPEFFDMIKKAGDMVSHSYECDAKVKGHIGTIFVMKNLGWEDKQTVDQTSITTLKIDSSTPDEELKKLIG